MPSGDKYKAALNAFKERLLASPLGGKVMKIVLFGSCAKGTAREDSDLDVLIVANNGDELSDLMADLTFDVQMEYRVGLEPVTAALDELFPLHSYFLSNAMRYGQEVYAVSYEELKKELAKSLKERAEKELLAESDPRSTRKNTKRKS